MHTRNLLRIPVLAAIVMAVLAFGLPPATAPVDAAAALSLPRATVPQGATVVVNGSGFTSPDNATVYIDAPVGGHSQHIQATAVVDGSNAFSAHLNLPGNVSPGTYTLTAKDAHGNS